jgi:hypothetical protein
MFEAPRYIQSSFSIIFARQQNIRRRANEFEDRLKGQYFQPQILPVPDDLDPEVPRMIFGSEHGYSQIVISQVSCVLNVVYSPDWQLDISKGTKYLLERTPILFDLLKISKIEDPYFCGMTTQVYLRGTSSDRDIIAHLARIFLKDENVENLHDLEIKRASIISNTFFSNIAVSNYRSWSVQGFQSGVFSVSDLEVSERGIGVVSDYNDRYAFNQDKNYRTTHKTAETVIKDGISQTQKSIEQVRGANL